MNLSYINIRKNFEFYVINMIITDKQYITISKHDKKRVEEKGKDGKLDRNQHSQQYTTTRDKKVLNLVVTRKKVTLEKIKALSDVTDNIKNNSRC